MANSRFGLVVLALIILLGCRVSLAQDIPVAMVPPADDSLEEATPEFAISLNLDQEPLQTALFQLLFEAGNSKVIGDPNVRVSATIRANKVDEAIEQFSRQTGFLIVNAAGRYLVYSEGAAEVLNGEPVTYLYRFRQVRAADILQILKGQPPGGFPEAKMPTINPGTISPNSGSGGNGFSGGDGNPGGIPDGTPGGGQSGISSPLGNLEYQAIPHLNSILMKGDLSEVTSAIQFLSILDRPAPMVLIDLLIVQYNHGDSFNWRFDLTNATIGDPQAPMRDQVGDQIPQIDGFQIANAALNPTVGLLNLGTIASGSSSLASSFTSNLQLLISNQKARVVTNPHLAVYSGTPAFIDLTEQVNFTTTVQSQLTNETGIPASLASTTLMYVTPSVISEGRIHVAVNAKLESFSATPLAATNSASSLPDQLKNAIGTGVILAENETLIIGGLVRETAVEQRTGVPWLQDAPVVGPVFRTKTTQRQFVETVIYITPHVTRTQGYEDDYRKQTMSEMVRMQEQVQEVKDHYREDKLVSEQYDRLNRQVEKPRRKSILQRIFRLKE